MTHCGRLVGFRRWLMPACAPLSAVVLGVIWLCAVTVSLAAESDTPRHVKVDAAPIILDNRNPARQCFDQLALKSAWTLTSEDNRFGGISAFRVRADLSFVAVSDVGYWLTGRVRMSKGRATGLDEVQLARIKGSPGRPLNGKIDRDAEGLALLENGDAVVAFERRHRIIHYRREAKDRRETVEFAPVGPRFALPADASFSTNKGIEAIDVAPADSRFRGQFFIFAERHLDGDGNHVGWRRQEGRYHRLLLTRDGGFDVTDIAFLSNGDLLVLERRLSLLTGLEARIRRVDNGLLSDPGPHRGEVVYRSDQLFLFDNLEGIDTFVGADGEEQVLLLSDNNFSAVQRTVLIHFYLPKQPCVE